MMRRRSSSRCCSRLIEPICRSSWFCSSGSATSSGIVILRDGVLNAFAQPVQGAAQRHIIVSVDRLVDLADYGLKMLPRVDLFDLQLAYFILNLILEVGAGASEFRHEAAHLPGNLRQLPGPEQDEGQEHNEDDLAREAEIHRRKSSYSICREIVLHKI